MSPSKIPHPLRFLSQTVNLQLKHYALLLRARQRRRAGHYRQYLPPVSEDAAHRSPRTLRAVWYLVAVLGIASFLSVFIFTARPWQESKHCTTLNTSTTELSYGNSSAEAVDAGCLFDVMSFTWSLPDCFDWELTDDFLQHSNWTWWFDAAGRESVPWSQVAEGQCQGL